MRLTAKKAVEITRELWMDMAATGGDEKKDWSGWDKYEEMLNDCPLCEYADRHMSREEGFCRSCPMWNRWEGKKSCTDDGTPWIDWEEADTPEERKAASQRLVNLCDKWLEDHEHVPAPRGSRQPFTGLDFNV